MSLALKPLTIGGLSKLTGCHIETIRYYEKISLLPAPSRTQGGHRLYNVSIQRQLIFICRARGLGFSLQEVKNLLNLSDGEHSCAQVEQLILQHLQVVREKAAQLQVLQDNLQAMANQCQSSQQQSCVVIESLYERLEPSSA